MKTLSDKMMSDGTLEDNKRFLFHIGDVKEFIKKLKEMIFEIEEADTFTRMTALFKLRTEIDKLAGEKLI